VTSSSSQPSGSGGSGRRTKTALFVSLAVNLLFVGIVCGALLHLPHGRPQMMSRELAFGPFTEALSPADRIALTEAFTRIAGSPREFRRAMKEDFARFAQALRTDPLDRAELDTAAAVLKRRGEQRLELGQRLLMERIMTMSPEARKAFADRLEDVVVRGQMRGDRHDRPAD
jgi:uncharacterized membrane protein